MSEEIISAVAAVDVARSLRTAEGVQGEMENLWRDCWKLIG